MKSKHDIIWLKTVDSTNKYAREHICELDNLSVVSAEAQTAGRGQRGNTWSAEAGRNLTFSICLKYGQDGIPVVNAGRQSVISEMTALAVTTFLAEYNIDAKIKWPNDIYVNDRKICGILIENALQGNFLSHSIIGIGLNVNQTSFDPSLPNPTSVVLCSCRPDPQADLDVKNCLKEFMDIFSEYAYKHLGSDDGHAVLRQMYLERMWHRNEPAPYIDCTVTAPTSAPEEFTGIIRGLSDSGLLLVELSDGTFREFAFKEISYVLSSQR